MKMISLLAGALLFAAPVQAQSVAPRTVVSQIAQAVEDRYFDVERGREIADVLRSEADAGLYDSLTDPRDLEVALTRRMKPLDQHFNVSWRDPAAAPVAAAPAPRSLEPVPFEVGVARRGQGFLSVNILPGNVAVIDMQMFADFDGAEDPARRQADAVLQMVSGADAVIFDLRDNGGGSPAMVGYLVSAFVAPGADVYNVFRGREGQASESPRERYASPRVDVPVFVLTSGRTGSAAEAFSYTLQAARRATVVGERSAGAANPGGPVGTPSGFSVFVSSGSPVNPITGGNWEGTGVQPDIEASSEQALDVAWKAALMAQETRLTGPVAVEARWTLEALEAPTVAINAAAYVGDYNGSRIEALDGELLYRSGRRPAWRLQPLSADLFFNRDQPYRRVRFERDAEGRVVALETLDGQTGAARRLRRGE